MATETEDDDRTIRVKTDTDEFVLHGRPCELSAYSFVPTDRRLPKERTYFNVDKQERYSYSTFDRQYLKDFGYDQKLHRDDREHDKARGLNVNQEEMSKPVSALSSSIYGKRVAQAYDAPGRQFVRIAYVQTDFFRRNGTNIKADPEVKLIPR
jgi:hypothetical protein